MKIMFITFQKHVFSSCDGGIIENNKFRVFHLTTAKWVYYQSRSNFPSPANDTMALVIPEVSLWSHIMISSGDIL